MWWGDLEPNETLKECSGSPLVFGEGCHVLIALDAQGDLILLPKDKSHAQSIDISISRGQISVGNPLLDETISAMLEACRKYDENAPAPLPPSVSAQTRDGKSILVDVFLVPREIGATIEGTRFLLLLREVPSRPRSRKSQMRQSFGLTITEADFADLLAQGMSVRDASERLCISTWTAHSHSRTIFQKTGTRRQAELATLLNQTGP